MPNRFESYPMPHNPTKHYVYFVSGIGDFPFDMLRFDQCWPLRGYDADQLSKPKTGKVRSIQLCSFREPTIARWSSFLWSVGTENLEA